MDASHEIKVFGLSSVDYLLRDFEPQAFGFKNLRRQIQTNFLNYYLFENVPKPADYKSRFCRWPWGWPL